MPSRTSALALSLAAAALALAVASCNYAEMVRKYTPADADVRARAYLELFTHRQTDAAMARLLPSLQTEESRQSLAKISEILRDRHFDSTKVIGANVSTIDSIRHVNLTYELRSGGSWFDANVATVDSADDWHVEGVNVDKLARPLEAESYFSLEGKPLKSYAWLLATILCPLISIGTAIFIATRRQMPKRWRWVLMAILGAGTFTLNWSTGGYQYNLLTVQLLSGGWLRTSPYSPYLITFSIPAGAAMASERYRRWRTAPQLPLPDAAPSAPASEMQGEFPAS
jgi:hypothetical protein